MKKEWYAEFFSGLAVELWQQAIPADATAREVQFAARHLRLNPGDHVLDIGCGHGRHAVPLAKTGYRVTGVDISPESLALAASAARADNVDVNWIQADLYRCPNLPTCDAVVWMGNGLGYADADGTQGLLAHLAQHVRQGSRLLLDSGALAESILLHFEEHGDYEFGGIRMRSRRAYEPLAGCLEIEYSFYRGDRVETRLCRQHVFTLSQLRRMFESAGWRLQHAFCDVDDSPYHLGARYAYVVAERV